MSSLTLNKPKSKRLFERTNAEVTAKQIDRENGVIRNVKLLGASSQNNRSYSPESRRKAVQLYEGCAVKIDHKPDVDERPLIDDVGSLHGIYEKGDGVYAREFRVIKSHPYADLIFEKAERFPETFGFSHHADGLVESDRDGREIVADLISVESVDLVTKPATNKSIFESQSRKVITMKVSEIIARTRRGTPGRKRLWEAVIDSEKKPSSPDVMNQEVQVSENASDSEKIQAALDKIEAMFSELQIDNKDVAALVTSQLSGFIRDLRKELAGASNDIAEMQDDMEAEKLEEKIREVERRKTRQLREQRERERRPERFPDDHESFASTLTESLKSNTHAIGTSSGNVPPHMLSDAELHYELREIKTLQESARRQDKLLESRINQTVDGKAISFREKIDLMGDASSETQFDGSERLQLLESELYRRECRNKEDSQGFPATSEEFSKSIRRSIR